MKALLPKRVPLLAVHGLQKTFTAAGEHVIDGASCPRNRGHDVQLADRVPLRVTGEIVAQVGRGFVLGTVRGQRGACEDQVRVEVAGQVLLEAVEALGLALATMPHVGVLDRHAAIFGDALPDARPAAGGVGLQVLAAELRDQREQSLERWLLDGIPRVGADPRLKRVDLRDERGDSARLLPRIGPIDIEPPLDAVVQEGGRLRALRDVLGRQREPGRCRTQQLERRVSEQVERVLDAPGAFDGCASRPRDAGSSEASSSRRARSSSRVRPSARAGADPCRGRISRSARNAGSVPWENAGSSAPSKSSTICHRASTTDISTASASETPVYAWSNKTIASCAGGTGALPSPVSRYITASSSWKSLSNSSSRWTRSMANKRRFFSSRFSSILLAFADRGARRPAGYGGLHRGAPCGATRRRRSPKDHERARFVDPQL